MGHPLASLGSSSPRLLWGKLLGTFARPPLAAASPRNPFGQQARTSKCVPTYHIRANMQVMSVQAVLLVFHRPPCLEACFWGNHNSHSKTVQQPLNSHSIATTIATGKTQYSSKSQRDNVQALKFVNVDYQIYCVLPVAIVWLLSGY